MFDWLRRLVGGGASAPAQAPVRSTAPAAVGVLPNSAQAKQPASSDAMPHSPGQRLPLVNRQGRVAGFALRLPPSLQQRLTQRGDATAMAAHAAALLAAARALLADGRQVLVQLPAALLARPAVAEQVPPGLLLLPLDPPDAAAAPASTWPQLIGSWRSRGVRIGVPDGPPADAPPADFVLLRGSAGGSDTLLLSAQRWQERRPGITLLATGLDSVDDIERVLAAGVTWAGGRLDNATPPATARPLQAAAHRICAMLNDLALDRDTRTVADTVRGDVALSYRLLRYANSPALGQTRAVDTVEQAVLLLGRAELTRWLSVLLLAAGDGRQASAALQEHALARGRLLEGLARRQGVAQPERLFTVGLLARLDLLLNLPLPAALEPLRLSAEASQALLQRAGPWAGYLALADALEGDDDARFATASAPFGGMDAVLADAAQAWAWAAQVLAAS